MNDRIRHLRKEVLKLSQTEFGKKIGLSPQGVAEIEKGRNVLTDRNFDAICKAFNVNPNWLRNGVGEMFGKSREETREEIIQSVVEEFGLTDDDAIMIRTYLSLTPEQRANAFAFIKQFTKNMAAQMGLPPLEDEKPDAELTREEKHARLDAELDEQESAEKRATSTSSASTGSSGASRKFSTNA